MSLRIRTIILFALTFLLINALLDFYTGHEKFTITYDFPDVLEGKSKESKRSEDQNRKNSVLNDANRYSIITPLHWNGKSQEEIIMRTGQTQIPGNIPGNLPSKANFFIKLTKGEKTIPISRFPNSSEFPPTKEITLDTSISLKNKKAFPTLVNNNNKSEVTVLTTVFKEDESLKDKVGIRNEIESKVIHRKYWETSGTNTNSQDRNSNKHGGNFKEEEQFVLSRIFGGKNDSTFWIERPKTRLQTNAFGSEYDHRFLNQLLWLKEADKFRPEVFDKRNYKPKRIAVRDGLSWWNYKGNKTLSCPGSPFGSTCEMVNQYEENVDAVITVRDAYHAREYFLPWKVANIYFILESPFATPRVKLLRPNDILASYWRGADIPTPYAKWAYYDPDITQKKQDRNYAEGKTKMVAVFMSNCGGMNRRINYIQELQKHIQVDFYGVCGNLRCNRFEGNKCLEMLKKHYRFYLAFENSNCRDYITEKFFDTALKNDVIPVVLGAHPDDYKAAAPHGSYIHVEDFDSPKALAQYLKQVTDSDILFNKYFQWRGTGEFVGADFFCRVCSMLHYAEIFPPPKRKGVTQWKAFTFTDSPDQMCLPPGQWYWKR